MGNFGKILLKLVFSGPDFIQKFAFMQKMLFFIEANDFVCDS